MKYQWFVGIRDAMDSRLEGPFNRWKTAREEAQHWADQAKAERAERTIWLLQEAQRWTVVQEQEVGNRK